MSSLGDLAYGAVRGGDGRRRACARLTVAEGVRYLDLATLDAELFATGTLDGLLAAGRETWDQVHAAAASALRSSGEVDVPGAAVLPFGVADYVDFYASEHHATTVGRIFRPDGEPLPAAWKHLPIGYHGRAGTVVVSGTDVRRPVGQFRDGHVVRVAPSRRLDFEAEVAFVVGTPSTPGEPVRPDAFAEHVFGLALLNDWSARDCRPSRPSRSGRSSASRSRRRWRRGSRRSPRSTRHGPAAARRTRCPPPYLSDPPTSGLELNLTVSIAGTW